MCFFGQQQASTCWLQFSTTLSAKDRARCVCALNYVVEVVLAGDLSCEEARVQVCVGDCEGVASWLRSSHSHTVTPLLRVV